MSLHVNESRTQVWSNNEDDGYINMEVNLSSPPHNNREFEFQMCSSTTSPADELFYKGQLLPLHLPPRLQMVQKLLSSTTTPNPPISPRAHAPTSPRRFSSSEIVIISSQDDEQSNSFEISTKFKKIKHSLITQKFKASRAYIKALFSKDEFHQRKTNPCEKESSLVIHRRSFSGVIRKKSSSSSSFSSVSSQSSSMRSSNASDNSIEGAIEHCKQSFSVRT